MVKDIFTKSSMLHFKLKGREQRAPFTQHIFGPYTHPKPSDWVKRSKHFSSHAAYQIKGMELRANASKYSALPHIPQPAVGLKGEF